MTARMIARRWTHVRPDSVGDHVIFGISLPSDTVVHRIRLTMHLTGREDIPFNVATMMALGAYILPVLDPDLGDTYEDIWNALVPKDTDAQVMDLDTVALDTTPFFEPGEANWASLFDVGLQPEEIFYRELMYSAASPGSRIFQDNQTPFETLWRGTDILRLQLKKRLRVVQPSVLVFALSVPDLTDTTVTKPTALAESKWGQVKYIHEVVRRAMLHVLGLTEAGAETPFEEATALLQEHLEPDMYEEAGGSWLQKAWDVFSSALVDHSTVGELERTTITTGR